MIPREKYRLRSIDGVSSELVLGQAEIPLATALSTWVEGWGEIHRRMIREWGQRQQIATLLQRFEELQGVVATIREEL